MTDRPPPYRIRRMRCPSGYRWVVMHHIGSYYITGFGIPVEAVEEVGHETWEQAMAEVQDRLTPRRHSAT